MQNGKRVKAESAKALARKNYSAYFSRTVFVHFSTCSSARAEKKSVFPPTGRITVDVATVMDAAKHTAVVDASLEKEHFPSSLPRRLDVVFFSSSSPSLLLLLLLLLLFCVETTLCDFIEKDEFLMLLVLLHILLLLVVLLLWWWWWCRRSSTRAKSVVVVVIPIVR
mgnify:CR=1 FL=1